MRRTGKLVTIALVSAMVALVAGCSSGGQPSGTDAAEHASGTITMWARDSTKGFITQIVDGFNKSQSDVKVELTIVPADTFVQKFGAAASTGSAPDVTSLDVSRMQYFASVGALADITKKADELPYHDDMSPSHLNLAEYQGKEYGVPFNAEASVLFYNKTLFTQAGLDPEKPPTNYAELQAAADKIHALGPDKFGYVFSGASGSSNHFATVPFIWASGGALLSDDGKTPQFDSPEVTDYLNLLKGLWDAGDVPASASSDTGPNASPAFLSGNVGMIGSGAFFVSQLKATDPGFDWGITPIPGKDGGTGSFAGGDELAIPSGSKNPDAAWEFIKYATDKEAQTTLANLGVVPVRTDLTDEIYAPLDPRYPILAEAMATGTTPKTTLGTPMFSDNQGPLATMINQAVFGGVDVKTAQETAQKAAEEIIANNG